MAAQPQPNPATSITLPRDTASNLKEVRLQLERERGRSITLGETIEYLLTFHSAAAPVVFAGKREVV